MKKRLQSFVMIIASLSLVLGSITLAGCADSKNEQDNCYGDDMPVVNED